jgi:hypothetical protein
MVSDGSGRVTHGRFAALLHRGSINIEKLAFAYRIIRAACQLKQAGRQPPHTDGVDQIVERTAMEHMLKAKRGSLFTKGRAADAENMSLGAS